jgi:hypothetical protein
MARGQPFTETWGFPPYSALAEELNFCNEEAIECGGLSQAIVAGLGPFVRRRFCRDQPLQPRFFVIRQMEQRTIFAHSGFRPPPAIRP